MSQRFLQRLLALSIVAAMPVGLVACHPHGAPSRRLTEVKWPAMDIEGSAPRVTLYGYAYEQQQSHRFTGPLLSIRSNGLVVARAPGIASQYHCLFADEQGVRDLTQALVDAAALSHPRLYDAPADAGALVLWVSTEGGSQFHTAEVAGDWRDHAGMSLAGLRGDRADRWRSWMSIIDDFVSRPSGRTAIVGRDHPAVRQIAREFRAAERDGRPSGPGAPDDGGPRSGDPP